MDSDADAFWVAWRYKDISRIVMNLNHDQGIVYIQILHTMCIYNGSIRNDPSEIGRLCHGMQSAKCKRIIQSLVELGLIQLINSGSNITCKIGELMLETRKNFSHKRGNSEQSFNKIDNGSIEKQKVTSLNNLTTCKTNIKNSDLDPKAYNIEIYLDDTTLVDAQFLSPKWDINYLIKKYNLAVRTGRFDPPRDPCMAFLAWVKSFTKGQPPS